MWSIDSDILYRFLFLFWQTMNSQRSWELLCAEIKWRATPRSFHAHSEVAAMRNSSVNVCVTAIRARLRNRMSVRFEEMMEDGTKKVWWWRVEFWKPQREPEHSAQTCVFLIPIADWAKSIFRITWLSPVCPAMTRCVDVFRVSCSWPTATLWESHSLEALCSPALTLSSGKPVCEVEVKLQLPIKVVCEC